MASRLLFARKRLGGTKVHFGEKGPDGRWLSTNEAFKHVSVAELENAIASGRLDAEALQKWFDARALEKPYPNAPGKDKLRVAAGGRIDGAPVIKGPDGKPVLGKGLDGETPHIDLNQNAIDPAKRIDKPTLITEDLKAKYPGKASFPSDTLANSHAEIAFMQNAYDAGLIRPGASITIPVVGRQVCPHCLWQLPLMAEKMGVKFMTVIDNAAGKIYYWHPGLKDLGLLQ